MSILFAPSPVWRARAVCGRPELAPLFVGDSADEMAEAACFCAGCPVAGECLDAAMREEGSAPAKDRALVRGGLTPTERATRYRLSVAPADVAPERLAQVEALLRDGLSNHDVGRRVGMSTESVGLIRRALGIPARMTPRPTYQSALAAFTALAAPLGGGHGHIVWRGPEYIRIGPARYSPRRVGFEVAHGRAPVGRLMSSCEHKGCIAGGHATDQTLRDARPRSRRRSAARRG
ncbi:MULTISPECIES: WhiB family transcriptional regulator [unclassified Streptomyces]|uniref:WhiB family transcriptional regulator n=1 Tax=unclassified Streptomyces TaxID=2593676 RepID=UPI0034347A86